MCWHLDICKVFAKILNQLPSNSNTCAQSLILFFSINHITAIHRKAHFFSAQEELSYFSDIGFIFDTIHDA